MSSVSTDAALFPVSRDEYGRAEYRRKIEPDIPWIPADYGGINMYGQAIFYPACDIDESEAEYDRVAPDDGLRDPPVVVGQVLAVQEEWATREAWDHLDDDKVPEGYCVYYRSERCEIDDDWFMWRPASTLPLWAVRRFERVTAVSVEGGEWVIQTQEQERE